MLAVPDSGGAPLVQYNIRIQYRKDHFDEGIEFKISGQGRMI
jgi:hypothetical protein